MLSARWNDRQAAFPNGWPRSQDKTALLSA